MYFLRKASKKCILIERSSTLCNSHPVHTEFGHSDIFIAARALNALGGTGAAAAIRTSTGSSSTNEQVYANVDVRQRLSGSESDESSDSRDAIGKLSVQELH